MVLETLVSPAGAERKPWEMFFIGLIYSSVAIFLSLWIFDRDTGLISVFLVTMASLPFIFHAMLKEEKKDTFFGSERSLLKEHGKALLYMMFLFFGITAAYVIWYIFLPTDIASSLFDVQSKTITSINNNITANAFDFGFFTRIFMNNIKVLAFSVLFSLLYGAGAMFILAWNASVIATAMGAFIRDHLITSSQISIPVLLGNTKAFYLGVLRYMIHGTPEILAYFVGGLAGGILSFAIMRREFKTSNAEKIIFDSSNLILIAVGLLLLAAFLEVFVTPLLL